MSEILAAVAKLLVICPTSQAEGCSLELWNAHKGLLWENFSRLVQEVKAQLRSEEPRPVAGGHHSSNGGGTNRDGPYQHATSASSAPPTTTTSQTAQANPRGLVLTYVTI